MLFIGRAKEGAEVRGTVHLDYASGEVLKIPSLMKAVHRGGTKPKLDPKPISVCLFPTVLNPGM